MRWMLVFTVGTLSSSQGRLKVDEIGDAFQVQRHIDKFPAILSSQSIGIYRHWWESEFYLTTMNIPKALQAVVSDSSLEVSNNVVSFRASRCFVIVSTRTPALSKTLHCNVAGGCEGFAAERPNVLWDGKSIKHHPLDRTLKTPKSRRSRRRQRKASHKDDRDKPSKRFKPAHESICRISGLCCN